MYTHWDLINPLTWRSPCESDHKPFYSFSPRNGLGLAYPQGRCRTSDSPFIPLNPITQAERLADGTTIFSLPAGLKWVARHDLSGFLNGSRFTDVCLTAPVKALANWRHVHNFVDQDGGTLITDSVSTRLPASTLTGMFAYRQTQLIEDLKFLSRTSTLSTAPPSP